ncbi:hypothetical protein OSTOST_00015 [Ostertagia ostertagi]
MNKLKYEIEATVVRNSKELSFMKRRREALTLLMQLVTKCVQPIPHSGAMNDKRRVTSENHEIFVRSEAIRLPKSYDAEFSFFEDVGAQKNEGDRSEPTPPKVVDLPTYFSEEKVERPMMRSSTMSVYVLNLADAEGSTVKSESYKFVRMADDLHDVATYLADMRLCLVLVTATGYLLLLVYLIMLCIRRNRRTQTRRRNWDYQMESQREANSAGQQNAENLSGVRTEGSASVMGRNHHGRGHANSTPSFMRHGQNHQQSTRLMADQDGSVIPHITTEPPPEENKAKVPRLLKESVES